MSAAAALADLAERVRPVTLACRQHLPTLDALAPLLPGGGLRRGSVVSVGAAAPGAGGAATLALALVSAASGAGSWVAVVGLRSLGLVAAAEVGVALERLVLVAPPDRSTWPSALAAVIDGFDVVLVDTDRWLRAGDARRLQARARERGAVLVALGGPWGTGAEVTLTVESATWEGLERGHGHLRARRATVVAAGRREASRARRVDLWLPGPSGQVEVAAGAPIPLRRGRTA